MGTRQVQGPDTPHDHPHEVPQQERQIQVDPNKIINRLRQQRAELEAQLDLVSAALEDAHEREERMLQRIAELETKK